jgi:carboxypeptidase D
MCLNVYDIRLSDTFPACGMNWPPDLAYVTPYLRRDDVRVALHVPKESAAWKECRGTVGVGFRAKNSRPSVTLIPSIIERGVPVMLFHGDQDLICNYIGAERLIENMAWNGYKGFNVCNFCLASLDVRA